MSDCVKVTAILGGGLAGDPPQLDSLLEATLATAHGKGEPSHKFHRAAPPPPLGGVPIPIVRERIGPWLVARCSSPIFDAAGDAPDYVCKRIEPDRAGLLDPGARIKMSVSNMWTKSYRVPLRVRLVERVVWFARGDARGLRKALKRVGWIGKKPSIGYGRVSEWVVEPVGEDASWFAPGPFGPVLMRPLPVGPWLPGDLIGFRKDFGACCPPYWHPERYTEIVAPC